MHVHFMNEIDRYGRREDCRVRAAPRRRRRRRPPEQKQHRQTDDGHRRGGGGGGRPVGNVAQRRLATRLTRVDFDPLADHDAPVLALARTVPFQRPQLLYGRGALVARRVRVPFHLRNAGPVVSTWCVRVAKKSENGLREAAVTAKRTDRTHTFYRRYSRGNPRHRLRRLSPYPCGGFLLLPPGLAVRLLRSARP